MARWITIKDAAVPFDYRWPDRTAITAFTAAGEHYVKDEVADFAVGQGYATEGKAKGSKARSRKGKTGPAKAPRVKADAAPADSGSDDRVDEPHLADDDRPDVQLSVDPDTEQR